MEGNKINTQCVVNSICHQTQTHYLGWSIGLIIAFLVIDAVIPLLMRFALPPLAAKWPIKLNWALDKDFQAKLTTWLKERLLWAFFILTLFRLAY
jgi:hypothetical protein